MIGVVADDITGASDIGVLFTKQGYRVVMLSNLRKSMPVDWGGDRPDVIIVDTDSRLMERGDVYRVTRSAAQWLKEQGCEQFFGKVCSVFRGHVGAVFDALLDELAEEFAVVVLGFPKNGRTTVDGVHYVHGEKLEQSGFRNDPVHPMTQSHLPSLLQQQTDRKVGAIDYRCVHKGAKALRDRIVRERRRFNYVIVDVAAQEDLKVIAEVVSNLPVICGSSAIAEEYPPLGRSRKADPSRLSQGRGVLGVAGSLTPQTKSQIAFLKNLGEHTLELDTALMVVSPPDYERHKAELVRHCCELLEDDRLVMVFASNTRHALTATLTAARQKGISDLEIFRTVSSELASLGTAIIKQSGVRRLLVAGGDTSAQVCRGLGISQLEIIREIEPGVPLMLSTGGLMAGMVLKSGSFGSEDFFCTAAAALRAL